MSRYFSGKKQSSSGEYQGNNDVNRGIPHGLGKEPNMIMWSEQGSRRSIKMVRPGYIEYGYSALDRVFPVMEADETYFYIGNASDFSATVNASGVFYNWAAFI